MSSNTSFLSQIRKGSTSKASRVVNQLQKEIGKINTQNVVIEDEGLTDVGATSKGRLLTESGKLIYTRKIITNPTHKVPVEPDGKLLTFWIKANHTGLFLKDSSRYNPTPDDYKGNFNYPLRIKSNNNRHFCLVDSQGLDLGYLGKKNGVNSVTAWQLNGVDESAQVDDNPIIRVKDTTTGISIAAWVKFLDFAPHNGVERRILAKSDNATNGYALFVTPEQKIVFSVQFKGVEYKTINTTQIVLHNTWNLIVATFTSTLGSESAKVYVNGNLGTNEYYAQPVTYPDINSFPNTRLQLFTNGIKTLINHFDQDVPPPWDFDTGNLKGMVRDVKIWREKVLTQQEITNYNNNKVSISNLALGQSHIAGFVWSQSVLDSTSSFTSTSFTNTSFNL